MKRIITYFSILAVALTAAVSCSREESFDGNQEDGFITLRLQTAEMGTRVTIKDGDDVRGEGRENVLKHADFFFFKDEAGATLQTNGHVRLTVGEDGLVRQGTTDVYSYQFNTTDSGAYSDLKGASYVYVIANYPETITATTLSDILALDIPISKIDLSEKTGEFDSFVMDSYNSKTSERLTYVKPSQAGDSKSYTIGLTRAAAKLALTINVADSYEDAAGNNWVPGTELNGNNLANVMWVNFINARKKANVAAEAVAFDNKDNYFTTSQKAPVSASNPPANHTAWKAEVVYTYPQSYNTSDVTAPYFKIFCPWTCEKKGPCNYYYKIILPELGSFQRNKVYNLTVNIDTVGGTEEDWALATEHVYVADWWAPQAIEAVIEGAMYLDVPNDYYEIYGIDDISIPVISSNDIQVNSITVSGTVTGTKTYLLDGSTQTVSATISDISKEGFKLTHHLDDRMEINGSRNPNFDCTPITYTLTIRHTSGGLSKVKTVTVVQYPSIYAKADESNGYAYVNSYAHSSRTGGRHASNYAYNSRGNNANGSDALGVMNWLGQSTSQNNNGNQYVVYVSVLPEGYKVAGMAEDVVIGDPRGGSLNNNYLGYYGNGASGSITRDVQSKYNAAATTTQNVIAPALRIASSWGATTTISSTTRAEERCAAYQENGYPAGRWRVPTVAEIDFLIRLSTYEHIPALFTTSKESTGGYYSTTYYSGYWANGPSVYLGKPFTDDGNTAPYIANSLLTVTNISSNGGYLLRSGTSSSNYRYYEPHVRCVYDEWYWSDQKYGSNGQPSNTAATQWIGYIF